MSGAPLPTPLARLLAALEADVADATDALETGDLDVAAWEQEMQAILTRGHLAAYMAGQGSDVLSQAAAATVAAWLAVQFDYLGHFAEVIGASEQWQAAWNSRAAMYAESAKQSYWSAATLGYPLPAMPTEGTQCLTRCQCSWELDVLEGEGNADAYWRLGSGDNCQTCSIRARDWSPVRIRNGELL